MPCGSAWLSSRDAVVLETATHHTVQCRMPRGPDDTRIALPSSVAIVAEEPHRNAYLPAVVTASQSAGALSPVPLRQELSGRLRNIGKPKHWLMAVAEAITNSLHAIEDLGAPGRIDIFFQRAGDLASGSDIPAPVTDVRVVDTGSGFTDRNYQSFCTADSLHKVARGGKGVGRLHCLQAFEQLRVTSVFPEAGQWLHRTLILQPGAPELQASLSVSALSSRETAVHLRELRDDYALAAGLSLQQIADWLAEHFLAALVERPAWLEALVVHDGTSTIDLAELVEGKAAWEVGFNVGSYPFSAKCYAVHGGVKCDQIRLVAGGRVVYANTREIQYYLPHLSQISPESPHVILIASPFLDEHVNDARNGVSFSDDDEGTLLGVTAAQFRTQLGAVLNERLKDEVGKSVDELKQTVESIVSTEAPHYRALLLAYFDSKEFANLSKTSKAEEILASIDAFRRRESTHVRTESRRLARAHRDDGNYWESARKLAQQVDTQKQVALAEYVSLRKIILERLQEVLAATDGGRPEPEEAVHNLIFPQGIDTESAPGTNHQLWILDERLESHRYLASDKPIDGKKGDRPDLLIALDRPGAFAAGSSAETQSYDRIVLVEFKRALRDLSNVPTDDLPHRQMMRYAEQILAEKALHLKTKRPITTASDVRFYLYAVCDLTKPMLERLKRDEHFTPSPTGDGAFAVANEGRYYMEYISLPKLVEDANARNRAFFERLGLSA